MRALTKRHSASQISRGYRQYSTLGNLADNLKAHLFLGDHSQRQRVKTWGEVRVEDGAELAAKLMPERRKTRANQAIVFTITAGTPIACSTFCGVCRLLTRLLRALSRLRSQGRELQTDPDWERRSSNLCC